jgi:hypothetical protein
MEFIDQKNNHLFLSNLKVVKLIGQSLTLLLRYE